MSDLSTLKEEILEWANKPGTMKKFTTHDVYDAIHSAETPAQTSDILRSMWKYDKTLEREEFMDGNRKKFIYSLVNVKVDKEIPKVDNDNQTFSEKIGSDFAKSKIINVEQQIEIPNNFCIELKTPNGFTITIKAGDLIK